MIPGHRSNDSSSAQSYELRARAPLFESIKVCLGSKLELQVRALRRGCGRTTTRSWWSRSSRLESAVLSGRPSGAHKIDGVGAGFVVPLWHDEVADAIETVSTEEATAMVARLAEQEGLFAGTSTGANVLVAVRMAERLPPNSTIVTVMCDTGMKYLNESATTTADLADCPPCHCDKFKS